MTIQALGSGAGAHEHPERPNITRLLIGHHAGPAPLAGPTLAQSVTVVETTVDDLSPELWPGVLRAVQAAGAWDCWTTATIGRHGRPGHVLTALCTEQVRPAVMDAMFRHSSTLGVRWTPWQRATLPRISVPVPVGPPGARQEIAIKIATGPGGHQSAKPELADAERAAQMLGWPVRQVCEAALSAYHRDHPAAADE
jgi:pyridinium-3,5-bisthiocarboxylic acid mononucleotide nickel chelatase